MLSSAAEEIQEKGRVYVKFVNDCFLNVSSQSEGIFPIWTNTGDAYSAPRQTNIVVNGKEVRFDLAYSGRRVSISTQVLQLFVEAKGSYDQSYIDRTFAEFLNKILLLKELILKSDWEGVRFVFVSPITPTSGRDPRIFNSSSDIKNLLTKICGYDYSEGDDKFFEIISKHILVLQLPVENSIIMLGEE